METVVIPHTGPRVETGPIQFGDDWPGIFIRGDNAFYYAMCIDQFIRNGSSPFIKVALTGLARLLESCDIRKDDLPPAIPETSITDNERRLAQLVDENNQLRRRCDWLLDANNRYLEESRTARKLNDLLTVALDKTQQRVGDLRSDLDGASHENTAAWSFVEQQNKLIAEASEALIAYAAQHEDRARECDRYGLTAIAREQRAKAKRATDLAARLQAQVQEIAK